MSLASKHADHRFLTLLEHDPNVVTAAMHTPLVLKYSFQSIHHYNWPEKAFVFE